MRQSIAVNPTNAFGARLLAPLRCAAPCRSRSNGLKCLGGRLEALPNVRALISSQLRQQPLRFLLGDYGIAHVAIAGSGSRRERLIYSCPTGGGPHSATAGDFSMRASV